MQPTNVDIPTIPRILTNDELIRLASSYIDTNNGLPLNWQKELIERLATATGK
jgi:hypothetical protein